MTMFSPPEIEPVIPKRRHSVFFVLTDTELSWLERKRREAGCSRAKLVKAILAHAMRLEP